MIYCVHTCVEELLAAADAGRLRPDDVLTFDDGHVNVHTHREALSRLPQRKVAFIVPRYVDSGLPRSTATSEQVYYQTDRVVNHRSQFMTLDEVRALPRWGIELGMHSYAHAVVHDAGWTPADRLWRLWSLTDDDARLRLLAARFGAFSALARPGMVMIDGHVRRRTQAELAAYVEVDTQACAAWFTDRLGFVPSVYAHPFNEAGPELDAALRRLGVTEVFGHGRLDWDDLVHGRTD